MNLEKKKIILCTDAWYPQVNGVVRCVEETKEFLEKNNFHVTIIHTGLFYSVPMVFYPEIKFSLFCRVKIKNIIKKEKPDYTHIFTEGPIGVSTRSLCIKNGYKFTTSFHTNFSHYVRHYFHLQVLFFLESIYLFFRRIGNPGYHGPMAGYAYLCWFHNASNGTMVATESLKLEVQQRGFLHVLVWPIGVDTALFEKNLESPVKQKYHSSHPVFIYLGRVSREKNVEAFLKLRLPGIKLIIGDGPLRNSLEGKYRKEAMFVGYKKGKELVNLLSVGDVLVFPSKTDTFGLVIIEALACGLPVAAYNVMGPKDIIENGVEGFLSDDLGKAAMKCLTINRENCRKKASLFSWEVSAERFMHNLVKN